jgi:hypothetical protein
MLAFDIIGDHPAIQIIDSSKIKDYITCERMYFFRHVLGWEPDCPNNHLSFGSAWHEAMEHLLLTDYTPANILTAYEKFITCYRKDFDPDTDELYAPKTPDNALRVLAEYCKRYARDNFKTLHTEISGKVQLTDDLGIYFKMDSVCQKPDGKIFSLEHKTASSDYNWEAQWTLAIQPGVYTHVLYCMYGPEAVDGITMNASFFKKVKRAWAQLREGEALTYAAPFDFLRYNIRKTLPQMQLWHANLVHHMLRLRTDMEILAECRESHDIMNAFHCRADNCIHYGRQCPFHDFCATWPNPLKKAFQPPIGFVQRYWDPTEEPGKTNITISPEGDSDVKTLPAKGSET